MLESSDFIALVLPRSTGKINMTIHSYVIISKYLTIIGWGFCDIQNNQGRGKSYQPKLWYHKNESNNCSIIHSTKKTNASATDVVYLAASNAKAPDRGHTWHDYPWPWVSLTDYPWPWVSLRWLLYNHCTLRPISHIANTTISFSSYDIWLKIYCILKFAKFLK